MKEVLLHTPEGVRDIYSGECARKIVLQERLSGKLKSYGYESIQTPTFEFFDIFNGETGTVNARKMYKFFDREGNTLVLRPDITPSIARAAAKYYKDEVIPLRFSYIGNVFINNSSYQGLMKESTQLGAELIGDDSAEADGEIIVLAIGLLLEAGLKDFQLDIGHADFFKALIFQSGLEAESVSHLRQLIANKNYFGIQNLIEDTPVSDELKNILVRLPDFFGQADVLDEAADLIKNPAAQRALLRLKHIYKIICQYGYEKYVTFDLAMLTDYDYYTGVIFRGYTYGIGDAVVKGGRYDHLLGQFGKQAPSVGLAVVVDRLMAALSRQKVQIPLKDTTVMIIYGQDSYSDAVKMAGELRAQKKNVVMNRYVPELTMADYDTYSSNHQIDSILTVGCEIG